MTTSDDLSQENTSGEMALKIVLQGTSEVIILHLCLVKIIKATLSENGKSIPWPWSMVYVDVGSMKGPSQAGKVHSGMSVGINTWLHKSIAQMFQCLRTWGIL